MSSPVTVPSVQAILEHWLWDLGPESPSFVNYQPENIHSRIKLQPMGAVSDEEWVFQSLRAVCSLILSDLPVGVHF